MRSSRQPSVVCRRPLHWRVFACLLAVFLTLPLTGAGPDRFNKLGHRMMCSCGCGQILLECNHVGCPRSDGMRNELTAGIQRGDSDDLVLQGFVQKYGATILAAPTTKGFNRVAWVMPYFALAVGLSLAIFFIKRWGKMRAAATPSTSPIDPSFREQARRETEL